MWTVIEVRMRGGSAGGEVLTEAEELIARRDARKFTDAAESAAGRRRPYGRDSPFHESSHSREMTCHYSSAMHLVFLRDAG